MPTPSENKPIPTGTKKNKITFKITSIKPETW